MKLMSRLIPTRRLTHALLPAARYSVLSVMAIVSVFPFFWMFSSSLRPPQEVWLFPPKLFPSRLSLGYMERIILHNTFVNNLLNSLIISLSVTILAITFSIAAGYSISRFKYRGRRLIARLILIAYMFPPVLLIIPMFRVMAELHLVNTRIGLIIAQLAFCFPYATWLLDAYFTTIPRELDEAAGIDGASPLGALVRIIIPLAGPGIVAATVFSFILSWNDFIFSLVLATAAEIRPLAIGLYQQSGGDLMVWGDIMAWSGLMTLPIFVFFLALQKQFIYGLTAGSIKG